MSMKSISQPINRKIFMQLFYFSFMISLYKNFLRFLSILSITLVFFLPTGKVLAVTPQIDDFDDFDFGGWELNYFGNVHEIRTTGGVDNSPYLCSSDEGGHLGTRNDDSGHTGNYTKYEDIGISFYFKGFTDNLDYIAFVFHHSSSTGMWWFMVDDNPPIGTWIEYSIVIDPSWTDTEAIEHGWGTTFSPPAFSIYLANIEWLEFEIMGYGGPGIPFEVGLDNIAITVPLAEFSSQLILIFPFVVLIIIWKGKRSLRSA